MSTARVRSRAPGFRSSKRGQSNRKRGKTVRKKELYRHQDTQRNFQPLASLAVERNTLRKNKHCMDHEVMQTYMRWGFFPSNSHAVIKDLYVFKHHAKTTALMNRDHECGELTHTVVWIGDISQSGWISSRKSCMYYISSLPLCIPTHL